MDEAYVNARSKEMVRHVMQVVSIDIFPYLDLVADRLKMYTLLALFKKVRIEEYF